MNKGPSLNILDSRAAVLIYGRAAFVGVAYKFCLIIEHTRASALWSNVYCDSHPKTPIRGDIR